MIAATAILSMTTSLTAQESQKLTANKHNEYGIIYALPVTHLNIEVEAVKTIKKAGPYYRYADKYLGVKNPVIKDSETWEIRDVQISPVGVPDKENEYLMKFKSGSAPFLMLDENGLPLSINIEPEEAVVHEVAVVVHPDEHVVLDTVDLVVQQRIRRQGGCGDLRVGQKLELVFRRRIDHRHLDDTRALIGLVDRELARELREAVAPFDTALHGMGHGLHRRALRQVGGVQTPTDAIGDLHAHHEHEHAHDAEQRHARDGLARL